MPFPDVKEELSPPTNICRLCLNQNSTYLGIFGKDNEPADFADALENLIGIAISPHDNWPKSVCISCVVKIQDFKTLISTARENENRLREIFGSYQLTASSTESAEETELTEQFDVIPNSPVKEEEIFTPNPPNDAFSSEDSEAEQELPRRVTRGSTKKMPERVKSIKSTKVPKKRGRKPKVFTSPVDEDSEEQQQEELVDTNSPGSNEGKKKLEEKIDTAIHAFFKMECVLCNINFPRFTDIQAHFRKEHKRRGYVVCCKKKLNRPLKLYEHMNVHINPTKHQCSVCQKMYKTHDSMLMHKKLQHTPVEERKYICEKCPKRFALAHALTAHMITHMAPEEKKHVCKICGQAFALATILVQHVRRVHENAHVQVCEICAKVFRCKNIFEKHMLEHNNQLKPTIPCTVCGKMFTYLVAMQRHRRRHDKSGSLECPVCQRVAANQQALQEHIKNNHRERKTFQCSLCERVFRSRVSLKEHMASHTGQVLYECRYCSKQFNSNANYFNHKKNAHPAEHKAEREKRLAQQVFLKPEVKTD